MQNRCVTWTNDVLVLQNRELRLELTNGVHGLVRTREHEPRSYIFVINAAQSHADVVSAYGLVDLVLHFIVNRGDFYLGLVWHQEKRVVLANEPRLNLAYDDRAHVLILFGYGDHEWRIEFALHHRDFIKELEKRFTSTSRRVRQLVRQTS